MRDRFPKRCVKKNKQQKRVSVCVSHSQCFPVIALCFLRIVVSKHLFRYGVTFQIFFFSCVSVGSRACLCCSRGFNSCSNSFPALNFSRDSLSTPSRLAFTTSCEMLASAGKTFFQTGYKRAGSDKHSWNWLWYEINTEKQNFFL